MIKTYSAFTTEVDDPEFAVSEIFEQIDIENGLMENTVGFLTCHLDYIKNGVVAALSEKLPFDVVGINTQDSCVLGGVERMALCLYVLTADDVFFAAEYTAPLTENPEAALEAAFMSAAKKLGTKPAMAFVFSPMLGGLYAEGALGKVKALLGDVPIFGGSAIDYTDRMREPLTILNGKATREGLSLVLIGGAFSPRFYTATLKTDNRYKNKAVVTESQYNQLISVNDVPIMEYLESVGLAAEGTIRGTGAVPLLIDYGDGKEPISRIIMGVTAEGNVLVSGAVYPGGTFSVGVLDANDVVLTARETISKAAAQAENGMFAFSSAGRGMTLGIDWDVEMNAVCESAGELPFLFAYTGGELCPIGNEGNAYLNCSLVVCTF